MQTSIMTTNHVHIYLRVVTIIRAQSVSVCVCPHVCCISLYSQQYLCDLTDIIIHIVAVEKQDVLSLDLL